MLIGAYHVVMWNTLVTYNYFFGSRDLASKINDLHSDDMLFAFKFTGASYHPDLLRIFLLVQGTFWWEKSIKRVLLINMQWNLYFIIFSFFLPKKVRLQILSDFVCHKYR